MVVNSLVGLAIANLVFYVPVFPLAVFVAWRQGFGRTAGWFFLVLLSVIRLVGEPMSISVNGALDYTNNISIAAYVLRLLGLSTLILATGGLLNTINNALPSTEPRIPARAIRLAGLIPIIAIILSIVSTTDRMSSLTSGQPPSDSSNSLRVASGALFLVAYVILLLFNTFLLVVKRHSIVERAPKLLLYATTASMPLLAVRVAYNCLVTLPSSPQTQLEHVNNIWEQAFMLSLMEFLIVGIFLAAGLAAGKPVATRGAVAASGSYKDLHYPPIRGTRRGPQQGGRFV